MTNVAVTDADREALWSHLLESCKGGPQWEYARACEDADAQAIARARAEEREAFARECEAVCPPAGLYTPGELSAYEAAVQDCAAAIRARSEGGKA